MAFSDASKALKASMARYDPLRLIMAGTGSPRFQLDVARYQLFDDGRPVHMERQPMELLLFLAERRDALATRADIAARLWPGNVHVDADQAINRIVRKLRRVFGDDPDSPTFIETVVGKGYRFVGPVEILSRPAVGVSEPDEGASPGEVAGAPAAARSQRQPARWLMAAIALAGVAAVAWIAVTGNSEESPEPALRLLTSAPGDEQFPSFSPDGSQLVFAWNGERRDNWDVYVKQVHSAAAPLRLTMDPAQDTMPAWSPDGRLIAFQRQQGSQFALYVISPLGGAERRVAEGLRAGLETLSRASWSADSQSLLVSDIDGEAGISRVLLIPTGAGEVRPLMERDVASGIFLNPVVSPAGRDLAYHLCNPANICDVYAVRLGDDMTVMARPRRLTADGRLARGLTWTHDSLAVIDGDGQRLGLRSIPLSGKPARKIELAGVGAMYPAVTKSAGMLAFMRKGWDIHLWRFADGGKAAPELFLGSSEVDRAPQLSPDGTRVVFASDRSGLGGQIWLADLGSAPVALTEPTGRAQGSARWSPDGRWIAYDAQAEDGDRDVYVVEASGGRPRRVTFDPSEESFPSWSRDGRWIYFGSARTGRFEVWRLPFPDAGEAQRMTAAGGRVAFESADGKTLYYTKTIALEGPLFARDLTGGAERQIIDSVYRWNFVPAGPEVYYLTRPDRSRRPHGFELRTFDPRSQRTVLVNTFESLDMVGLTVSADRQTVLSSGIRPTAGDDLMLIQHFR